MIATFVPRPWATPDTVSDAARAGAEWLFAREGEVVGPQGTNRALQWLIKRNCSITPRQLGAVYLSLCCVSMLIAGLFYWHGAPFILAFAGLELLFVGVALLAFARRAGDRETLTLVGRSMQIEQCFGRRTARTEFVSDWLTVEPAAGRNALVQLAGQGQRVHVGRFVRPEFRAALARELRFALRRTPAHLDAHSFAHTDAPIDAHMVAHTTPPVRASQV